MTGPCLCGDPACGRCFPAGQARMKCDNCNWHGPLCDCSWEEVPDGDRDGDYAVPLTVDTCPMCGCGVQSAALEEQDDGNEPLDDDLDWWLRDAG